MIKIFHFNFVMLAKITFFSIISRKNGIFQTFLSTVIFKLTSYIDVSKNLINKFCLKFSNLLEKLVKNGES